eukprot:SAG31_NODE_3084_length_4695_cov_3.336741_2_plen_381_part_00
MKSHRGGHFLFTAICGYHQNSGGYRISSLRKSGLAPTRTQKHESDCVEPSPSAADAAEWSDGMRQLAGAGGGPIAAFAAGGRQPRRRLGWLAAAAGESLMIYDVAIGTATSAATSPSPPQVTALAMPLDRRSRGRVLVGFWDGAVALRETERGVCGDAWMVHANSDAVRAIAALPVGAFAVGDDSGEVVVLGPAGLVPGSQPLHRLSERDDTVIMRRLAGHTGPVSALVALPGNMLASGSWDGTIRIWDLKTGEARHVIAAHDGPVLALVDMQQPWDGGLPLLASGGQDRTIKLWAAGHGQLVRTLVGHKDSVAALAVVSADPVHAELGLNLVSGSTDGTIRLWDHQSSCEAVRELAGGHNGRTVSVNDHEARHRVLRIS